MNQTTPVITSVMAESFPVRTPGADGLTASSAAPVARPWPVTAVCILEFIRSGLMALLGLAFVITISADVDERGLFILIMGASLASLVAAQVTCVVGIWRMRRWGLYSYAVFQALLLILTTVAGSFSPFQLLPPMVTLLVGFYNVTEMD